MKKITLALLLVACSSCGYSSRQNDLTGQVKKAVNQTPLICPDRVDVDLSLGVMRNGVGSMSTQDVWLTVPKAEDAKLLTEASATGALVKVTYDVARVVWCSEDHLVTHVELVK